MLDILVENGKVVDSEKIEKLNIGISGEKISYIGKARPACRKRFSAEGKFVFPGVIDPHVHFSLAAYGAKTCDDYYSASLPAVSGGVTAVIDYAIPVSRNHSLLSAVSKKISKASASVFDYSFHPQILGWNGRIKREALALIKKGFPTFKIFMPATEGWGVSDFEILKAIEFFSKNGAVVEFHAENGSLLDGFLGELLKKNRTSVKFYSRSGPDICEAEAVRRVSYLSKLAGGRIYICHLTSLAGLAEAEKARAEGILLRLETCPQYLFLNDGVYKRKDGFLFCLNPVLKKTSDNAALIRALFGKIDWIGTDHCAFSYRAKAKHRRNFTKIPRGLPGIGMSFPLLFTEFRRKRKPLPKLAELLSENPAKYFGFGNKGKIRKGFDADFFIVDPGKETVVVKQEFYGWSPYEGLKLSGFASETFRRGELIYREGELLADRGSGKLVFRSLKK